MNVISTNWKNWSIVLLAVFLTISILFACNERRERLKAEERSEKINADMKAVVGGIKRVRDEEGREHIIFPTDQQVIKREMAKESRKLDTAARIIGIKKKDIINYERTTLAASATGLKAEISGTIEKPVYTYKDQTFTIGLKPKVSKDSLDKEVEEYVFDVGANIDLRTTSYRKRKIPLIGRWTNYTDIYATDPRITISGVERLTVNHNPSPLGLALQGASYYNASDNVFFFGPGIRLELDRGAFLYNHYYDPRKHRWVSTFGLRIDVARF